MTDPAHRELTGGCHCGTIRFRFAAPQRAGPIPVRACGCSFCTKHGGVWTSDAQGRLEVTIADPTAVHRYRFGTGTADFHVCRRCGVVPVVTSEIAGALYAVVNVNCFEDVAPDELDQSAADFDGEGTDDRLARRARNWIPAVTFTG